MSRVIEIKESHLTGSLPEGPFDTIICRDLIARIPDDRRRLFLSELGQRVRTGGSLICSTPVQKGSRSALHRFSALIETEFVPVRWQLASHRLYDTLPHWLRFKGLIAPLEWLSERVPHLWGVTHATVFAERKEVSLD